MSARNAARSVASARDVLANDFVPWVRPSAWLPLPDVAGQQRLVGVYRVDQDDSFAALLCRGAYTVDWGDGTLTNHADNTIAYKRYTYSALPTTGESALGHRQVVIQVYPQSGSNLTTIDLNRKHNFGIIPDGSATGWLDIAVNAPFVTSLVISGVAAPARFLKQVWIGSHSITNFSSMLRDCVGLEAINTFDTSNATNLSALFFNCYSMRKAPQLNTSSATNLSSMFTNCASLHALPSMDTSKNTTFFNVFNGCVGLRHVPFIATSQATNFASMFSGCASLEYVPQMDASNGVEFGSMFSGCRALRRVPTLNTSNATSMANMFSGCLALQDVPITSTSLVTNAQAVFNLAASVARLPAFNMSAVTSGNFLNTFAGMSSLHTVEITGINQTVSFANCKLSAAALNTIFTNLSSTGTGKTITVTGNYGASTCDTSIATAKGWTVTV